MTIAQLEERLENLEKTVARLQVKVEENGESFLKEEDIIDGAEYDLVTELIPRAEYRFRAKIVNAYAYIYRIHSLGTISCSVAS